MASYTPPIEQLPIFDNAVFNSVNGSTILTVSAANLLYLRKTYADTATALETFNAGIAVNTIQPTATATTMLINSTMTSGDMYIGSNVAANNVRTGIIHIGDSNAIASGGAVHINNGTTNTSTTQIMNGLTTSGNLNLMTGGSCSGSINIGSGNSSNPTVNILTGQNCTGIVNIASSAVGTNTVITNIGNGNTSGQINIGNTGNATVIGGTCGIGDSNATSCNVTISNGNGVSNSVLIASGTGTNGSTVGICTGTTTGTVTIGNTSNIVRVNGALTIGTGKNITLQPTAGYIAPTTDTMLGGITSGTFTTPSSAFTGNKEIATMDLVKATYLVFISFQANYSTLPSTNYITLSGTLVGAPSFICGYSGLASGAISFTGSFPISVTTAGTLILNYNTAGTINSLSINMYKAVRIS